MSETLQEVQARLDALGVRDVKLTFSPEAFAKPVEEVKEQVAIVLRAYLDGLHKPVESVGDSKIKFTPVPGYADLMTLKDFFNAVNSGFFVSGDGSGYYVKDGMESNVSVWGKHKVPEWATHVAWYNK